jgi:tRNA(fMet)-specific endonuclease VapC
MNLFILDTDSFSLYLRGRELVCRRIVAMRPDQLALAIVTVEESLTGWYSQIRRAQRDQDVVEAYRSLHRTFDLLRSFSVLAFDLDANRRYQLLRKSHRRVAGNDLRIASIVLNEGSTLVTRNTRDFAVIAGLPLEAWSQPERPDHTQTE